MNSEIEMILNATHDAIIAINQECTITIFNTSAGQLTGVVPSEVLGTSIWDVIPTTRLPDVLESGIPELNRYQPLGDISIVTNRMPVYNAEGKIVGAIAIFRDITEVKEMAEELTDVKEVRAMLQAIFNATSDAISVVDEEGKGIMINPAYTRLTGYTEKDVIGKLATVDLAEGESVHLRVLKSKKEMKHVRLKVGPNRREVIVNASPIVVNDQLMGSVGVIHDLTEFNELIHELNKAKKLIRNLEAKYTFEDIIGEHDILTTAIEKAKLAAVTPATVILRGESGTGKELFAHAIHNASNRKNSQFVRVNCAAIHSNILESELFGYEEGAFTGARKGGHIGLFEQADGGTIFLDEIGEVNLNTQAKLLRVLQEKEILRVGSNEPISVDVRIISATNRDLEKEVQEGKFRKDLYYRLNVVPIRIPSLREHKEDIPELVHYLINKYNQEYGRSVADFSSGAIAIIDAYDWPGNVRELENYIGRAMINMTMMEHELEEKHLPAIKSLQEKAEPIIRTRVPVVKGEIKPLSEVLEKMEKQYIKDLLTLNEGNREKTAKELGISIRSLYYKLSKYND
ncbi:MAG: sigma-54-dependent transcriptional regulator [Clostridia bacterium]|nr:sigma-54-dependent transcriptional regulator [Clostridia bacterium]